MATVVLEIWFAELAAIEPGALDETWRRWLGDGAGVLPDDPARRRAHQIQRLLLSRHAGSAAASAPFEIGPHGKPRLASAGLHFSMSHTAGTVLVALAADDIGIDIETPRTLRIPQSRRERLIGAANAIAPGYPLPTLLDSNNAVLRAWVRLEALAKANGDGMARLLTEFGVFGGDATEPADAVAHRRLAGSAGSRTVAVRDLILPIPHIGAIALPTAREILDVRTFPCTFAAIDTLMRA